ncbi:carbon-nitrogen family hydrolase [Bacillus sp. CGMCC 1.16607]|uniref:carbon-nitrogen family hydrolase n=1 Tax=Bacillus sp. CGMCC 1.16607 TaxID=3351842 RepID=UPI00362BBB01
MKFNLALIQMDIHFGDPKLNFQKVDTLIEQAMKKSPDIIVLPELWTTGYDLTNLSTIADNDAIHTIEFLKSEAKQHGVHIIGGSIANKQEDGIYNTLLVINREGELVHQYSKLHLFQLMDEHLYLKPGGNQGIFSLDDQVFAGQICYDIRFPEWIRAHVLKGAKAIFVVAEWPAPRLHHWKTLLTARAIENQCYVIACNCSGSNPDNVFAGHSLIIDPWGEIIAEGSQQEEIIYGEIDIENVRNVRNIIPIFQDRKPEHYEK